MIRRYSNTVPPSLLQVEVDDDDTVLDIGDTSAYPSKFPFIVAIERGTSFEEACLVTDKDATTLTVTRGYDGTQAVGHPGLDSSGEEAALVEHATAAIDYREAGISSVTEDERDDLDSGDSTETWDGRAVYNSDRRSVELAHIDGEDLGWFGIVPTGTVLPFSASEIPSGFLLCDGGAHSRDDHPGLSALYDADGFPFGNGDGSTTFNVPDLRQRFPLGKADSGTGDEIGESGGDIDHVHTGPSHTHNQPSHSHSNPNVNSNGNHNHSQGSTDSAGSHNHSNPNTNSVGNHTHSQGSTGGASPSNQFSSKASRGLTTINDSEEHHHSFSSGTSGDSHSHTSGGYGVGHTSDGTNHFVNGSSAGDTHSHSVSGNTSSGQGTDERTWNHDHGLSSTNSNGGHSHSQNSTGSGGGHTHNLDPTNSDGSHVHSQGNTGSAGNESTGSSGTGDTGSANPPFLALFFIVKT